MDHPRSNLVFNVPKASPLAAAHSVRDFRSPRKVTNRLKRALGILRRLMAFSGDIPRMNRRFQSFSGFTPATSAHAATGLVAPRIVIRRLFRLFRACCTAVAQRQFAGKYPLLLSIRSRLVPSGGCPMSLAKASKDSHRRQTRIPRPPYNGQLISPGFLHRARILHHVLYSRVSLCPWVRERFDNTSKLRHRHERVNPLTTWLRYFSVLAPQSHLQSIFFPAWDKTKSLPNLRPEMSFVLPIGLLLLAGCTGVQLPDVKVCYTPLLAAGGDCMYTLSGGFEEMTAEQFVEYLEPTEKRGPALCLSTEDYARLKTAIEQLCYKAGSGCTKEVKKEIQTVASRMDRIADRRKRPKPVHPIQKETP